MARPVQERRSTLAVLCLVAAIALLCYAIIRPLIQRYGLGLLLPPSTRRLNLTNAQHREIIENHTFVVVGGSHRGGTTIFWRLLASHPDVSGFPEHGVETDFAEGSFLQTVLPTFGVGTELMGAARRRDVGLGRYAFSPSAHMDEHHPLNTNASSLKLVSEWGYHWNLSRPVLLEKTPTDMLTSRLLQALLTPPQTSFIFITRHPLAVALAHRRWRCCDRMSVQSLLLHWAVGHRLLALDLPHLARARTLRYEDLALRPSKCLHRTLKWLDLRSSPSIDEGVSRVSATVTSDANRKYEKAYCKEHLRTRKMARTHCAMANALQPVLDEMGLGYDLRTGGPLGFSCVHKRLIDKGFAPPSKKVIGGGTGSLDKVAAAASARAGGRMLRRKDGGGGRRRGNHTPTWPAGAKACDGVAPDPMLLEALGAHASAVLSAGAASEGRKRLALGDGGGTERQLCHYKRKGEKSSN